MVIECTELLPDCHPTKFIVINSDEYRQFHPRAQKIGETYGQDALKYTQAFSNALVEQLKSEYLQLSCNFIIEGTMRSFDVIQKTAQQIKQDRRQWLAIRLLAEKRGETNADYLRLIDEFIALHS